MVVEAMMVMKAMMGVAVEAVGVVEAAVEVEGVPEAVAKAVVETGEEVTLTVMIKMTMDMKIEDMVQRKITMSHNSEDNQKSLREVVVKNLREVAVKNQEAEDLEPLEPWSEELHLELVVF